MLAALDWILAENQREGSPYYGKIDPALVAFSGHSCGGLIAMTAALDPRAKVLVLEDSGLFKQPSAEPQPAPYGLGRQADEPDDQE